MVGELEHPDRDLPRLESREVMLLKNWAKVNSQKGVVVPPKGDMALEKQL